MYSMPKVDIGDLVVWHIEGEPNCSAQAAIVTAIHPQHLDLTVFVPSGSPILKTSVRHIKDPFLVESKNPRAKRENGGWDYSPQTKRLMFLEGMVSDLTKSPRK